MITAHAWFAALDKAKGWLSAKLITVEEIQRIQDDAIDALTRERDELRAKVEALEKDNNLLRGLFKQMLNGKEPCVGCGGLYYQFLRSDKRCFKCGEAIDAAMKGQK